MTNKQKKEFIGVLETERLYQRKLMDQYKHNKLRWEIHKEIFFCLERLIERVYK